MQHDMQHDMTDETLEESFERELRQEWGFAGEELRAAVHYEVAVCGIRDCFDLIWLGDWSRHDIPYATFRGWLQTWLEHAGDMRGAFWPGQGSESFARYASWEVGIARQVAHLLAQHCLAETTGTSPLLLDREVSE